MNTTPNPRPLVIYHGNCADGFTAAWVAWRALNGEADFHPGVYQNPPPDVAGRIVYMLDFSYKRPVMEDMLKKAISITILDHHQSAIDDLTELMFDAAAPKLGYGLFGVLDSSRSGARLAWDYFMEGQDPPALVRHVEDRDLWKFELKGTREYQAAVFSYPYEFEAWEKLAGMDPEQVMAEGRGIDRKLLKDVNELIDVVTRWMVIDGHRVPMANLPYTYTSEAGHALCKKHGTPFAGCYWDTPEGRVFSLRSLDDGMDVQAIAKKYGGGGHAHAAGFRIRVGYTELVPIIEEDKPA